MSNDFANAYSERDDDELLLLASDRTSLATEAAAALDAELRRRNLNESDRAKYEHFVRRNEQHEARKRHRRIFGTRRDLSSWLDLFWILLAIALISIAYLALPNRYHMKADWEEAAVNVMFASVFIAVVGRSWWRRIGFWMSLASSSTFHILAVHAWVQRSGSLSKGQGKLAFLFGVALFFAIFGFVWLLRKNFYGEETREHA